MTEIIDFVLHFDDKLAAFVADYGVWTYAILFAIIFCETGLVVTPILPGDSLLFAVGVLCRQAGPAAEYLDGDDPAHDRGDSGRHGQLPHRQVSRPVDPQRQALALAQSQAPGTHALVLRALRRQDDHHRPLRADRAHVRPVRRRRRQDELRQVPDLQRHRRHPLGRHLHPSRLVARRQRVRRGALRDRGARDRRRSRSCQRSSSS